MILSPADLDSLAGSADHVAFETGEVIVRTGDRADAFYVIKHGSVTVSPNKGPLVRLGVGDSFGEIGVFRGGVRTATVRAQQPTEVVRIQGDSLLRVFRGDPANMKPVQEIIDDYDAF